MIYERSLFIIARIDSVILVDFVALSNEWKKVQYSIMGGGLSNTSVVHMLTRGFQNYPNTDLPFWGKNTPK